MNTPLSAPVFDPTAPSVSITSPANDAVVSGNRTITADAGDDVGVAGVQFYVDGTPLGPEDTAPPYAANWDTRVIPNGAHTLTARARDTDNKTTLSALVNVTVANSDYFQNQVLATGFTSRRTSSSSPTAACWSPSWRARSRSCRRRIRLRTPGCSSRSPTSPRAVCSRGSTTSLSIPISPPTATTTSSTRSGLRRSIGWRGSPPMPRSPARCRGASSSSTRIRHRRSSSTTAAPSRSATTGSSTSRPASTSRGHRHRTSRARAERSTASTRTGSCRSTTRSTTAPDPTGTRCGPMVFATLSEPTSTARPTGSTSVTSAGTSTTRTRR